MDEVIDVNLKGVFVSARAVIPHMISCGSGRIVATSSMAGRMGNANIGHYVASKWGVIGLVKTMAIELAPHGITVNALCPTSVKTDMIANPAACKLFRPDFDAPTLDDAVDRFTALNVLPVPWVEVEDISVAMMFLVSDGARYHHW